jgi:DNA-binding NtrC family response regulator
MPPVLQAKLLRVLEDHVIVPVGATQPKKLDVRVLAGTNANLNADVAAGRFRSDLFFRLARFNIDIPPLRERPEDIPLLADHFLRLFGAEMRVTRPTLTPEAMTALLRHRFPGNVRELKNLLERALIESGGGAITPEHLRFVTLGPVGGLPAEAAAGGSDAGPSEQQLDQVLRYVRERGSINNAECRHLLSASLQHACYLLRKASAAGLLQRSSSGRWARYHLATAVPAAQLAQAPAPTPTPPGTPEPEPRKEPTDGLTIS